MRYGTLLRAFVLSSAAQFVAAGGISSDDTSMPNISTTSSILSLDPITLGVNLSSFPFASRDAELEYSELASTVTITRPLSSLIPSSFGTVFTPARTVDAFPISTADYDHHDLKQRDEDENRDDFLPSSPLPSLPGYGAELTEYLQSITEGLTKENKWLDHKQANTFGTWFPFSKSKTAAGVTGLYGCTSVMIVSKKGVHAAHIYEDPVFVTQTKFGTMRPTAEDYFRKASFDALVNGDPESKSSKPIKDLIGTDTDPGPLHHTLNPKIFLISPFKNGGIGPLMYAKRIQWLSDQLHAYIYPSGTSSGKDKDNKPTALPYKVASKKIAEMPNAIPGKAIMESTPIHRYDLAGDQLNAIGRWRLWVNGKEAANWEYVNEDLLCPVQCGGGDGGAKDVEMEDAANDNGKASRGIFARAAMDTAIYV
ncbi:hypothetical protein BDV06DRAFT_228242 [Aspergillus oleicola]